MVALLAVYHRGRGCVGVCDARCYNAMRPTDLKQPKQWRRACVCICGGANHARGLNRAVKNIANNVGKTRADLEAFAAKLTHKRTVHPDDMVVIDRAKYRSDHNARKAAAKHFATPAPTPLFECTGLSGMTPAKARRAPPSEVLPSPRPPRRLAYGLLKE